MPTKKSASPKKFSRTKNTSAKKVSTEKTVAKKNISKKIKTKAKINKPIPKGMMPVGAFEGIPNDVDCVCMQKKPNGKFYNFKLQEGRWVQASAIPFPTKEICEDASC